MIKSSCDWSEKKRIKTCCSETGGKSFKNFVLFFSLAPANFNQSVSKKQNLQLLFFNDFTAFSRLQLLHTKTVWICFVCHVSLTFLIKPRKTFCLQTKLAFSTLTSRLLVYKSILNCLPRNHSWERNFKLFDIHLFSLFSISPV